MITITAENPSGDVRVRVAITVLKNGALDPDEAKWMVRQIADGVMLAMSNARYLMAPMSTQKVSGA
jgi:hypothetical protein